MTTNTNKKSEMKAVYTIYADRLIMRSVARGAHDLPSFHARSTPHNSGLLGLPRSLD